MEYDNIYERLHQLYIQELFGYQEEEGGGRGNKAGIVECLQLEQR